MKYGIQEERKQTIAAKSEEEKERFSRESKEQVFQPMGRASKAALHRVQGFWKTKKVEPGRMETVLLQLKKDIRCLAEQQLY